MSLVDVQASPLYQRIAQRANQLRLLGLNCACIAGHLGVDEKTVAKAVRWLNEGR